MHQFGGNGGLGRGAQEQGLQFAEIRCHVDTVVEQFSQQAIMLSSLGLQRCEADGNVFITIFHKQGVSIGAPLIGIDQVGGDGVGKLTAESVITAGESLIGANMQALAIVDQGAGGLVGLGDGGQRIEYDHGFVHVIQCHGQTFVIAARLVELEVQGNGIFDMRGQQVHLQDFQLAVGAEILVAVSHEDHIGVCLTSDQHPGAVPHPHGFCPGSAFRIEHVENGLAFVAAQEGIELPGRQVAKTCQGFVSLWQVAVDIPLLEAFRVAKRPAVYQPLRVVADTQDATLQCLEM